MSRCASRLTAVVRNWQPLSAARVAYDDNGDPTYLGVGLLIRWSEIEYVEFVVLSEEDERGGQGTTH